jgi:hypothetical protein
VALVNPTQRSKAGGTGKKLPDDAADRVKAAIDLRELVESEGIALRREGREWRACCPFHNEKTPSFSVVPDKAIYHCFGCGEGGDAVAWMQKRHGMGFVEAVEALAERAGISLADPTSTGSAPTRRGAGSAAPVGTAVGGGAKKPAEPPRPRRPSPYDFKPDLDALCRAELASPEGQRVLDYLQNDRKLSRACIDHFNLGALVIRRPDGSPRGIFVAMPCYVKGVLVQVRFRPIPGPCLNCPGDDEKCPSCRGKGKGVLKAYLHCPDRPLPLYNVDSLTADTSASVLILEGEHDVHAAWDYGFRENVVTGTGGSDKFDDAWYDALEPYRGFVMGQDQDGPGQKAADREAKKLGLYRCSRLALPHKDLNDCLKAGVPDSEIQAAIRCARPMVETKFSSLGSYRHAIERRIATPTLLVGLPTGSSRLDRIMGGWRPGLFVVTGDTGSGKTSFTAWALREQALRGVPSLGTCFEQSPEELSEKFLRMQVGGDFTKVDQPTRFAAWDALDAMPAPVHFVDHYGRIPKAALLDAIRYAVRRLGVRFVVLDHVGYVDLGEEENDSSITRFMIELATLGKNEEVCIAAICHPNRMNVAQQRRVTMKDLKGSSGIEQNAHAVLVIERGKIGGKQTTPFTTAYLDKVRSEFGMPGSSCVLAYDPLATTYADEWALTPMGRAGRQGGIVSPPAPAPGAPEEPIVIPTRRGSRVEAAPAPPVSPEEDRSDPSKYTADGQPIPF